MKYSFLKESAGRKLIGASAYASRNNVVKQIIASYPNGKALSAELVKLAKKTSSNPKLSAKYMQLSQQCVGLTDPELYRDFVKKIAGFSKLWSTTAKVIGGAAALAGAGYLTRLGIAAANDPTAMLDDENKKLYNQFVKAGESSPTDPKEFRANALSRMSFGDKASNFMSHMKKTAIGDYNTIKDKLTDWNNRRKMTNDYEATLDWNEDNAKVTQNKTPTDKAASARSNNPLLTQKGAETTKRYIENQAKRAAGIDVPTSKYTASDDVSVDFDDTPYENPYPTREEISDYELNKLSQGLT